jgi:hypothetical protein
MHHSYSDKFDNIYRLNKKIEPSTPQLALAASRLARFRLRRQRSKSGAMSLSFLRLFRAVERRLRLRPHIYANGGMNTSYTTSTAGYACPSGASGLFCAGDTGVDLQQGWRATRNESVSIGVAPVLTVVAASIRRSAAACAPARWRAMEGEAKVLSPQGRENYFAPLAARRLLESLGVVDLDEAVDGLGDPQILDAMILADESDATAVVVATQPIAPLPAVMEAAAAAAELSHRAQQAVA